MTTLVTDPRSKQRRRHGGNDEGADQGRQNNLLYRPGGIRGRRIFKGVKPKQPVIVRWAVYIRRHVCKEVKPK